MAASAKVNENTKGLTRSQFEIANTTVIYHRARAAVGLYSHATAGTRGRIKPFTGGAGELYIGPGLPHHTPAAGGSAESATGNTSASPPPSAGADLEPYISENIAVAGVADREDFGRPVYATDDNTFTITQGAGPQIGIVWKGLGTDAADVLFFGVMQMLSMMNAQSGEVEYFNLGHFDWPAAADGNVRTGFPAPTTGKITEIFAMMDIECTGSGGTAAYNLEIAGVNVTGGVVTISTAAAGVKGGKIAGTAITALNDVVKGDLIDVECSGAGGTRTTGRFDLWIGIRRA